MGRSRADDCGGVVCVRIPWAPKAELITFIDKRFEWWNLGIKANYINLYFAKWETQINNLINNNYSKDNEQEQFHGKGRASRGKSAGDNHRMRIFFYNKCTTRICLTLKMKIKVMEYNIHNVAIRWRVCKKSKSTAGRVSRGRSDVDIRCLRIFFL